MFGVLQGSAKILRSLSATFGLIVAIDLNGHSGPRLPTGPSAESPDPSIRLARALTLAAAAGEAQCTFGG